MSRELISGTTRDNEILELGLFRRALTPKNIHGLPRGVDMKVPSDLLAYADRLGARESGYLARSNRLCL